MTIKRRLFISNIMMLIIPVILGITVVVATTLTLTTVLNVDHDKVFNDGDKFYKAVTEAKALSEKWEGREPEQIITDIDGFGEKYRASSISLVVYRKGEQLHAVGNNSGNPVAYAAISEPGENYFTFNGEGFYTVDAGKYKILLTDSNHQLFRGFNYYERHEYFINIQIIFFTAMIIIILATSSILTRFLYRNIVTPLEALAYGVYQIRDGNLDYRINYAGRDEFAAICSDFNEMAERLMDIVTARQKDEENRKELIAGISHDLRTPLTSIKTYIEGIELGLASTPQMQKRYFDTIKSKTKDMEHIINQLFLFSKLDTGEFPMQSERLNLGKWLSDYVGSISEEYAQRGLQINASNHAWGTVVNADGVQLRSVLTNILENSLKYGNKENVTVRISCRGNKENAVITLMDNGPGVPEETLDKLFNVFYRGDKARSNTSQGSGLGLAISAKIIEQLGGTVKAENLPEGGLCLTVTLPVTGEDANEKNINY